MLQCKVCISISFYPSSSVYASTRYKYILDLERVYEWKRYTNILYTCLSWNIMLTRSNTMVWTRKINENHRSRASISIGRVLLTYSFLLGAGQCKELKEWLCSGRTLAVHIVKICKHMMILCLKALQSDSGQLLKHVWKSNWSDYQTFKTFWILLESISPASMHQTDYSFIFLGGHVKLERNWIPLQMLLVQGNQPQNGTQPRTNSYSKSCCKNKLNQHVESISGSWFFIHFHIVSVPSKVHWDGSQQSFWTVDLHRFHVVKTLVILCPLLIFNIIYMYIYIYCICM